MEYSVSIERSGRSVRAGILYGNNADSICFKYTRDYLESRDAVPVSVSMPLQSEPFTAEKTRCYFDGLLPEGFTRRSVAAYMHLPEDDYIAILYGLGSECLGALRITDGTENENASYEKLSVSDVRKLASEGTLRSSEMVSKARLSLAGASGKAGLYYNADNREWYLPHGIVPSTHIVKQSHIRLSGIVVNEQLCLMTAAKCGISVPDSFIVDTGCGSDSDVLFATERYDRSFAENSITVSGLKVPLRLHQEDFAQALGVPSSGKYERRGACYLKDMFTLVRMYSADPVADQLKLWDMIVFDWLIGNTDAHLKNFSLVSDQDLRSRRLAPAYDIVSTVAYEESPRDMSFRIGDSYSVEGITPESFRIAAAEAGIGVRIAMRQFDCMCQKFADSLKESSELLSDKGYVYADAIRKRILEAGGINNITG